MEVLQYRVRKCSKCSGDLEFECITCQSDLCQRCKENHLIVLSNKDHDVTSYRERSNNDLQERCDKHPRMVVQKYCQTCRTPSCFYCRKHRKHRLIDIWTACEQKRQQIVQTIHIIKHETLFARKIMLKGIKIDIRKCHANTPKNEYLMKEKAQTLNTALDNVLKYKLFVHRCLKQKNVFNTYLAWIQCFETKFEESSFRPIDFLKNIKKVNIPHTKDGPYFLEHGIQQLTIGSFKVKDLIALLCELKFKEKGKRCVGNDHLFKLMPSPLLQKSILRTDVAQCFPDSSVTSDLLVVEDESSDFNLMHKTHEALKRMQDNLLQNDELDNEFGWIPKCLHCSPFTGDILVGMQQMKSLRKGRIDRYEYTGKLKNKGPDRYWNPLYVVENNNGDIVVSDNRSRVVGTDHEGKDRFELDGLRPYGICTDALSHILVCAIQTSTVQVFDKNGVFLRHLLFRQPGLISPCFLAYDINTYQLWIWSDLNKRVCVYSYLTRPTDQNPHTSDSIESSSGNQYLQTKGTCPIYYPERLESVIATGYGPNHISCTGTDYVWFSCTPDSLFLTSTVAGSDKHTLMDVCGDASYFGRHTVNKNNELIYIDKKYNIIKLSSDLKNKTEFIILKDSTWKPFCVYSSKITGDLLIGMYKHEKRTGKVNRYNHTGELIQCIQYNDKIYELYCCPKFITENQNGDVVVSESDVSRPNAVVVTDHSGQYRFSYIGHPPDYEFQPLGICTDELSRILICDKMEDRIHIIDKDGQLIAKLSLSPPDEFVPYSIAYDITTRSLWVGAVEGFYGYEVKLSVSRYEASHPILTGNSETRRDKSML